MNTDTAALAADHTARVFNAAREACRQMVLSGDLIAPADKAEASAMIDIAARIFLAQDETFRKMLGAMVHEQVNA